MVVLPEGEEILDVICGDKDFWVISATHNIAHVKPAKEGAATNLNLVTASGDGLLVPADREERSRMPDLKVYVNADPDAPQRQAEVLQRRAGRSAPSAADGSACGVDAATRGGAATKRSRRIDSSIRRKLQFPYGSPKYEKPFLVRSIWHDGQFTYIKSDATELPALYEVKDGKPALVNFQVREGTYVVPKVLDHGYLALGKQRFTFEQQGR